MNSPITPVIPTRRKDLPPENDGWACELKLDGYRGLADTINGRMLSKNHNPLKRLQHLLDALPLDCVFDGEICVLDSDGDPNSMIFYSGGVSRSMWFSTFFSMSGKIFAPYH